MMFFDFLDVLFMNVFRCTTDDLDSFAGKATEEENEKLAIMGISQGTDENGLDKVASEEDRAWFFSIVNR